LLIAATAPADAAFQVTLRDSRGGGAVTTVTDGGSNDSDLATNGSISITSLVVGGYTFTGTLATNNSPGGTPFNTALESSSFDVKDTPTGAFTGAGTASIYANATGFAVPVGANTLGVTTASFTNKGSSTSNGVGSVTSYLDPANAITNAAAGNVVGTGTTAVLLPTTSAPVNNNNPNIVPAPVANYALNLQLQVTFAGAGGDWTNGSAVTLFGQGTVTNPVPEPASMAMWGLGLLGCMVLRMRRRKA